MITPHILALSLLLSFLWGDYLLSTLTDFRKYRDARALTSFIVALCLWAVCFSYTFRTICVLLGVGEQDVSQIVFFALLAPTLIGGLLVFGSRRGIFPRERDERD